MTVHARPPTGIAGWPNLLVEGMEKRGKTTMVLRFTADPRVGACYIIEVGERRADEYAALGRFQIVEHNGTLGEIVEAIRWVMAQPPLDGRPNVLIIDTGTGVWDKVKRRAEFIARSSQASRRILEEDENAEITIGHAAWNKAKDPFWWAWLNELRGWPGICLITARADEVSKFLNGQPVAGQTDYRVELESGTRFILDGQVRVYGPTIPPKLITAAKLGYTVPDGGEELPTENPLGHVVFGIFEAGTTVVLDRAHAVRAVISACVDLGDSDVPEDGDTEGKRTPAKMRAGRVWRSFWPDVSPTEFDAATMAKLLEAVYADHAAEKAPEKAPENGPTGDGDAGTGDGADNAPETGTGESGPDSGDVTAPEASPDPTAATPGDAAPPADHAPSPADDGAHDLDDETLAGAPTGPSTVMDDPEVEAEAFAVAYVQGKSKTSCVAELALRSIARNVRGADVVDLRNELADIIVEERMGRRPPPAPDLDTAPPPVPPAETAPVADQGTLT